MKAMLTIGVLARRVGISASALRYYETQGILRPQARLPNGYRVYGDEEAAALRFLRRAQRLGFTLAEIRRILGLVHRGQVPCECVEELLHRHLHEIDTKIGDLMALRSELQALLARRPVPRRGGKICPIIER